MTKETAMKILKELHDNSLFSNRTALETIIPELAYDNDERIRKDIIAYIKKANGEPYNVLPSGSYCVLEMITWLQKQGEQKHINDTDEEIVNAVKDTSVLDMVEPKFKVKYAGSEYNVLEIKDIAGVTYYGIEDEPNHIDYVQAANCERVDGYNIKENGSPFPIKPAKFSKENPAWSEEDEEMAEDLIKGCVSAEKAHHFLHTPKEVSDWLKSLKDRMKGKEDKQ